MLQICHIMSCKRVFCCCSYSVTCTIARSLRESVYSYCYSMYLTYQLESLVNELDHQIHTQIMAKKKLLLVLTCICNIIVSKGEISYCRSDCHYAPSLYLRICCVNSNLGQTVRMRENNHKKIIICPLLSDHILVKKVN